MPLLLKLVYIFDHLLDVIAKLVFIYSGELRLMRPVYCSSQGIYSASYIAVDGNPDPNRQFDRSCTVTDK